MTCSTRYLVAARQACEALFAGSCEAQHTKDCIVAAKQPTSSNYYCVANKRTEPSGIVTARRRVYDASEHDIDQLFVKRQRCVMLDDEFECACPDASQHLSSKLILSPSLVAIALGLHQHCFSAVVKQTLPHSLNDRTAA
eukprot:5773-Heterococcus_DN1.PRE.4